MDSLESPRRNGRTLLGLLVVLFGTLLLLNNVDVIYVGPVWRYWPIILIIIGINTLFNKFDGRDSGFGVWKHRRPDLGGGIWLIVLGLWFLISINHFWGLHFRDTWPILLIAWGAGMIWGSQWFPSRHRYAEEHHGT